MCVIIDANRFAEAVAQPPASAYRPLIDWLLLPRSDGVAVFGGSKYAEELRRAPSAQRFFVKLVQAGRAKPIAGVDAEADAVRARCVSDDEHIVALARLSGARVVCTEDGDLMSDVRDPRLLARPRGRVYRNAGHRALLHHDAGCQRREARGRHRKRA
ncbi:MAG: hypothetical protein HY908_20095 [Myxococcales bacterium]|nr:hypothetical protein [Myxococcales bacterium]